jgi:exoribonuclease R
VTYFVQPDSPIDKEAAHRSTSTYLVERRLDMLPGLLTTQVKLRISCFVYSCVVPGSVVVHSELATELQC